MAWMEDFYDDYDAQNLEALMDAFAEDAVVSIVGNPPVLGKPAIRDWFSVLFTFALGVEHVISHMWYVDDSTAVCEFRGNGHRADGASFSLPGLSITERVNGKIVDFRTYTDTNPPGTPDALTGGSGGGTSA